MKKSKRILQIVLCVLLLAAIAIIKLNDVSNDPTVDPNPVVIDNPENGDNGGQNNTDPTPSDPVITLDEDGSYYSKDDVALYIHIYGKLPNNFVTKTKAKEAGWEGGSIESYFPGCCIGGDKFSNSEGLLPKKKGRQYYECDIDTLGQSKRGSKRIVFSNDGLIYYTDDHYDSFTLLYGEE